MMKHFYLVYSTMWTEGHCVVCVTDTQFPSGYDAINGGTVYVTSLQKLFSMASFNLAYATDDIEMAAAHDSALYRRYGVDPEELKRYEEALKKAESLLPL